MEPNNIEEKPANEEAEQHAAQGPLEDAKPDGKHGPRSYGAGIMTPDTISDLEQIVAPGDVQIVQTAEARWEGVLSFCAFIFMTFVSALLGTAFIYQAVKPQCGVKVPPTGPLWCFFQRGAPYVVSMYNFTTIPVELCSVFVYYSLSVHHNLRPYPISPDELQWVLPSLRTLHTRNKDIQIYLAVGGRRLSGSDVGITSVLRRILADTNLQEPFLLHTLAVLEQHGLNGLVLELSRAVIPESVEVFQVSIDRVTNFLRKGHSFMTERGRGFTFIIPEDPKLFAYYKLSDLLSTDKMYAIQITHNLYHTNRKSCPAPYISDRLLPQKIEDIDGMINDAVLRAANEEYVSKLMITVSFIGALYLNLGNTTDTDTYSPGRFYRTTTYRKLCAVIQNDQWDVRQDPQQGTDCLCAWKGSKWASVFSPHSGGWIAKWKSKIKGVAIFGLHGDDYDGKCGTEFPLINHVRSLLLNSSTLPTERLLI
ncbi:uncharacterized protein LOC135371261 isoform X2 [Ornithodoros turicata]|uniref:uncharacterized protein LOC135371261 isoform X2 n=1 Tax=Ornithodoros turicata TaxID=34597 RepID=UPI00313940EB